MGLTHLFDGPFYTGSVVGAVGIVPALYPVALNGRGFLVDLDYPSYFARFHHQSIPVQRPQQDTGTEVGEHSLNPEGLWRRSQSTWHRGAGQTYLDLADSDRARFRSSKGIDPWTRWSLSLLPDTTSRRSSSNTNLALVPVGSYLYLTDGTSILYTQNITVAPTWTTVTGGTGAPVSACTDGFNLYTAHTANGIYKTTRGAATTASYATGSVTLVGYVRGRLMAAFQNNLYNVIAAGALPTALFSQANTDFSWVGFAESSNYIFMAGFSGQKSLIYSTTVKTDGTALDPPHVAGELPDGEIVRSIKGYLGFICLGTDKGVRFCAADTNGNLQIGALISTPACYCFEGQDRFVWFGWTNYDATSTGLGRMDLTQFIASLTPSYASDLMATTQGTVTSVATFQNIRVFAVSAVGVFAQTTNLVASGSIDSGLITYDLSEEKVALFLDVKHDVMPAGSTHQALISADGGTFTSVGVHTALGEHVPFPIPNVRADALEIRETLVRATDATKGPVLHRHTLRSDVVTDAGAFILVPFLLAETIDLRNGSVEARDVNADLQFVTSLRTARTIVSYQEGAVAYSVLVDDYDWLPHHLNTDGSGFTGTVVAKLKVIT